MAAEGSPETVHWALAASMPSKSYVSLPLLEST